MHRSRQVIILRPPHFSAHTTHFIIQYSAHATSPSNTPIATQPLVMEYCCLRLPPHLQTHHWAELLAKFEHTADITHELVLLRSHHTHILSKMESAQFIHTYIPRMADEACMLFELPRFGLEFEQREGQILSLDYSGYSLAQSQQLVSKTEDSSDAGSVAYTLPNFQQYLVLQQLRRGEVVVGSGRAEVLVLVPVGVVKCSGKGADDAACPAEQPVQVVVSHASGASVKVRTRFLDVCACRVHAMKLAWFVATGMAALIRRLSLLVGCGMILVFPRWMWLTCLASLESCLDLATTT